jgi:hypothetical protein
LPNDVQTRDRRDAAEQTLAITDWRDSRHACSGNRGIRDEQLEAVGLAQRRGKLAQTDIVEHQEIASPFGVTLCIDITRLDVIERRIHFDELPWLHEHRHAVADVEANRTFDQD